MKATEFVKWFGWNITKYNLKYHLNESEKLVYMDWILSVEDVDDLKRLVESHELVESRGGLISAKKYMGFLQSSVDMGLYHGLDGVDYKTEIPLMKQAIAGVEACQ